MAIIKYVTLAILLLLAFMLFADEEGYKGVPPLSDLIQIAKQGMVDAQYVLGGMYAAGDGVEQNYQEAFRWYKLAAEQGLADAQNNLGFLYDRGQGVVQNDNEAFKWYKLAAEQGKAYAQCNLGNMYYSGRGVVQNYKEAFKWYKLSAEQGYGHAQYSLGIIYAAGLEVEQNNEQAYFWYILACANGNSEIYEMASNQRDIVAKELNTEQIEIIKRDAQTWMNSHNH